MGKIKQGILGGFSGRVGGIVGSSWKGIATIKSRPLSVANPKTPAQVAQRDKMKQVVIVARLLLAAIIQPFWNPFSQRMSGYNAFVKENLKNFTDAGLAVYSAFFSQRGSLVGFQTLSASATEASGNLTVDWEANAGVADGLSTDKSNIVYYNATQDYWNTSTLGGDRGSEEHIIADANMAQGDVLHVYCGYVRANLSKVSDSEYKLVTVG